jgi:hypothetical protein
LYRFDTSYDVSDVVSFEESYLPVPLIEKDKGFFLRKE